MFSVFAVLVQLMLFIVNLLMKTDSTVKCVPCMREHVCYEPFSLKNCRFGRYIMNEFLVLSGIHVSETQKSKCLCKHVLGTCVQNFIPLVS